MQPEDHLSIAIVGAGLMGKWHAHAARQNGAVVAAIIDPNIQAAKALAGRYRSRAFSDFEQALGQAHFDLVHICTPLSTHVALAKQALMAEKHVIIEKPLAPTPSDVSGLQDLAARKNLLLCPVHQFAFQQGVASARKELARRNTGPLAVSFDFASAGGMGREARELNQILIDILPHPLSILSELWPEAALAPETLFADNPRSGELFAHIRHQGFPVSIKLSLNARPTHCSMTIYDEQGAIHVNLFHGFSVFESPAVSRLRKILSPFALSLQTLIAATSNLLKRAFHREPAYPGLRTLVHQCYRSVQQSVPGPISHENTLAIATLAELVEGKLLHTDTTERESGSS